MRARWARKSRNSCWPRIPNAAYAPPGYLLFWREGGIMAQPFDARSLQLKGRAEAVADHTVFAGGQSLSVFSVSQTGVLAVGTGGISGSQLYWFDRNGKQLQLIDTESGVVIGPGRRTDDSLPIKKRTRSSSATIKYGFCRCSVTAGLSHF